MRAAGTLYPSVIRPGIGADSENSIGLARLLRLTALALGKAHDAAHDGSTRCFNYAGG